MEGEEGSRNPEGSQAVTRRCGFLAHLSPIIHFCNCKQSDIAVSFPLRKTKVSSASHSIMKGWGQQVHHNINSPFVVLIHETASSSLCEYNIECRFDMNQFETKNNKTAETRSAGAFAFWKTEADVKSFVPL